MLSHVLMDQRQVVPWPALRRGLLCRFLPFDWRVPDRAPGWWRGSGWASCVGHVVCAQSGRHHEVNGMGVGVVMTRPLRGSVSSVMYSCTVLELSLNSILPILASSHNYGLHFRQSAFHGPYMMPRDLKSLLRVWATSTCMGRR